ncbi:hypothetical protein NXW09_21875 [Bacteroides ovatus]|nr:hypothetical protein [Bacteroides ovatus]
MRTITLIYDGTFNTYRWLKAMMWARNEFHDLGYKIKYASIFDYVPYPKSTKVPYEGIKLKWDTIGRFDIVFLAFHHSQSLIGQNSEKRIALVKFLKQKCKLLCWLDTADSTGTCLFDVLPYVDLYFKKQLLKDTNLYTNEFYCARLYSDYYHQKLGLTDESLASIHYHTALKEYLHKLRVSWNVAFYDRMGGKTWIYKHPFKFADPNVIESDSERTIDVHYGGSNPKVYGDVVGYQRKKMLELIMNLRDITHPDVYKKISREEYLEELKHSKSIASPFGWGECCLRRF